MDFDEDDLGNSQDSQQFRGGGGFQRPTTSGGQRPNTASRPISRRGSAVAANGIRPFSRQSSAMGGGRQIGMEILLLFKKGSVVLDNFKSIDQFLCNQFAV